MNIENKLEITGCDLYQLIRKAYELSQPQGLGFLHFRKDHVLSDDEIKPFIHHDTDNLAVYIDYLHGRAVKLTVYRHNYGEGDRLFLDNTWYDHTEDQLTELFKAVMPMPVDKKREFEFNVLHTMVIRANEYGLLTEVLYAFYKHASAGASLDDSASNAMHDWDL